ncbi:MAG TPA: NAD(P)/FAD-dependent oxidoreductase [Candidatus Deferrimicrobiaceae bacterium]|nr:NAD(P)/FAD-dependent oxidoreductase [Candidatus Deferrimicrobiaceae bacterium]
MRYLILGGGPAGIAAAKAIRKKEKGGSVILATEEADPPYLRPLLPDFLAGITDPTALADPQGANLGALGIEVRRGKRAKSVYGGGSRVLFDNGTEESYDFLLIATGGKPVLPAPLDRHPKTVVPFDSLADAKTIRDRAKSPGPVIVYGPGYVAIEACRAIAKLGRRVIWIRPDLPRFGYPISGEFEATVLDRVRHLGVRILEGNDIASLREVDQGVFEVRDLGGLDIRCSMVVAATERLPAVDFLKGSGVKVGTGIVVDDHLRTNVPGIFAAGDCAELVDEKTREVRINFGWRSAIKQGKLAGENMAGGAKRYIRRQEDYLWLLFGTSLLDRSR